MQASHYYSKVMLPALILLATSIIILLLSYYDILNYLLPCSIYLEQQKIFK